MFLSRPDLFKALRCQDLQFDPPVPDDRVAQVSIDLLLGRRFTVLKEELNWLGSIIIDPSLFNRADLWEHYDVETFDLEPGKFVLAQTHERVHLPDSLMGFVEGRSSYARLGITVHATAPKIDPGFDGNITLELANFGSVSVKLRAEIDRPAQLLVAKITTPVDESDLYGENPTDLFQGQTSPIPHTP